MRKSTKSIYMLHLPDYSGFTPYKKFMLLAVIALISSTIFSMLGSVVSWFAVGINPMNDPGAFDRLGDPGVVTAIRILQTFTSIGLFVVPPFLVAMLISQSSGSFLGLQAKPRIVALVLTCLLIIFISPVVNYIYEFNKGLSLPPALSGIEQWMTSAEKKAEAITKALIETSSWRGLLVNIIIIGIIPAIGEELLFRGVIQRLFSDWLKHTGWAVIITALIFSTIHMQFFGFLPRFMLGVVLGYLFVWSGSLWLPILAHFVNNAATVLFMHLEYNGITTFRPDNIGISEGDGWVVTGAVVLSAVCLWGVWYAGISKSIIMNKG